MQVIFLPAFEFDHQTHMSQIQNSPVDCWALNPFSTECKTKKDAYYVMGKIHNMYKEHNLNYKVFISNKL